MKRSSCATLLFVSVFSIFATPARGVDKAIIKKSIDRGLSFLRSKMSGGDSTWNHPDIGATALAGLTLLECGVSADDSAVQGAADAVRKRVPIVTGTYGVSLSILFLDRLGDPRDLPLIDSLVVRLLAGQTRSGGYGYAFQVPDGKSEDKRLSTYAKDWDKASKVRRTEKRSIDDMAPEIRDQLARLAKGEFVDTSNPLPDNSNTQFAALALWVGRRHGHPVDGALERIAKSFGGSQNTDGGWGYSSNEPKSRASMTCAGLLGMETGYGYYADNLKQKGGRLQQIKIGEDKRILSALAYLAGAIDHPASTRKALAPQASGRDFYMLWSLERVAMIMNLETIGGKDWYNWGAEILLVSQQSDGSWKGDYAWGGADTCFALLFLNRKNMFADLSDVLSPHLKGTVVLRSGGKGGDKLLDDKKVKPAIGENPKDSKKDPDKTEPKNEAARLARDYLEAPAKRQERLLEELREGKGGVYTEALATAIAKLDGAEKKKARAALSDRLTRMNGQTLSKYLKDSDSEIRRAAAWACANKNSKLHIPELIELLSDREPTVAFTANEALREITGQKYRFDPGATAPEKAKLIMQWKDWWGKQGKE